MSSSIRDPQSQAQDNLVKDTHIGGNLTFAPVQIGTQIETQVIQISVDKVTQKPLNTTSPYQGLKKFNLKDRDRFFGRDKLIARLFDAVNRSSLSLVLGASGSGKSSVVRSGLIPELAKSLEAQTFYDFIFTPNQDPFDSFYRCLLSEEKDYSFSKLEAQLALEGKADTLLKVISTLKRENERWLLFIDQFEELFTLCDDLEKRKNFMSSIVRIAKSKNSFITIVLAMRSDFLEQLSFFPDLGAIANKNNIHLVTEMYPDELRQAIEQPAAKHGVVFEEGLVKQIIHDVEGQKGYLPLLQHTLNLLWEHERPTLSQDRTLKKKSYAELEGVRGALQKQINDIYYHLEEPEKVATKQIFLKLLSIIDTDLGSRAVSRRAYRSEFVGELVEKNLNRFIDAKLLVSSSENSASEDLNTVEGYHQKQSATIEIAHEILLSSWDILKRWIDQEKEVIILKNWLASEAKRWHSMRSNNQQGAQDELLKGSRLSQVQEFRDKGQFDNLGSLSAEEQEFIEASIEWRDRSLKEQEERRKRQLIAVSITFIFLASFSLFAGFQWRKAEVSEIRALRQSAELNWRSDHQIEALLDSLRIAELLDGWLLQFFKPHAELANLERVLPKVVYSIHEFNRLERHTGGVKRVRFQTTSNGETILTRDRRGIAVWHLDGRLKQRYTFSEINDLVQQSEGNIYQTLMQADLPHAYTFSPNGEMLVRGGDNGTVFIHKNDGTLYLSFQAHSKPIMTVTFSPDGQTIATGSWDHEIRLWNLDGTLSNKLLGHGGSVNEIDFSRDGNLIASAGLDSKVKLWQSDGTLLTTLDGHEGEVWGVSISPDGQRIASASNDGTVKLWSRNGALLETLEGHQDIVRAVHFNRDGDILASASDDGTVKLWQLGKTPLTILKHDIDEVYAMNFNPDGETLVTTRGHGDVTYWTQDGMSLRTGKWHYGPISVIQFSPDGQLILTASGDRGVRLSQPDGTPIINLDGHQGQLTHKEVIAADFSPDSEIFATGDVEGTVEIWQRDGTRITAFDGHQDLIWALSFRSDGEVFASASRDRTIKLWNRDGTLLTTLMEAEAEFSALDVAFSPDLQPSDSIIAAAFSDGTVRLWRRDGTKLNTFQADESLTRSVAFSPDGQFIATGGHDNAVKLWNRDGRLHKTFYGHSDSIKEVMFSPNGQVIASVSDDKTVHLWNVETKVDIDGLHSYACNWMSHYLNNHHTFEPQDQNLCDAASLKQ